MGDTRNRTAPSIGIQRHFTQSGDDVYGSVKWETRTARIQGDSGEVVFEQADGEVPETWSPIATNIVASKYFRGHLGTSGRERSVATALLENSSV